jgi:hypothetical protein
VDYICPYVLDVVAKLRQLREHDTMTLLQATSYLNRERQSDVQELQHILTCLLSLDNWEPTPLGFAYTPRSSASSSTRSSTSDVNK